MKKQISLLMLLLFGGLACSKSSLPQPEPPGKAVELTAEDRDRVSYSYEDMRLWLAWQTKGNKLKSSTDGNVPTREDLETALYCFHQAEKAWPKKLPESAPEERKRKHLDVPMDTLIAKGHVYLLLHEPRLAKYYYEKWSTYFPGNSIAAPEIANAEAMLKGQ